MRTGKWEWAGSKGETTDRTKSGCQDRTGDWYSIFYCRCPRKNTRRQMCESGFLYNARHYSDNCRFDCVTVTLTPPTCAVRPYFVSTTSSQFTPKFAKNSFQLLLQFNTPSSCRYYSKRKAVPYHLHVSSPVVEKSSYDDDMPNIIPHSRARSRSRRELLNCTNACASDLATTPQCTHSPTLQKPLTSAHLLHCFPELESSVYTSTIKALVYNKALPVGPFYPSAVRQTAGGRQFRRCKDSL